MSTFSTNEFTCGVCGKTFKAHVLTSTHSFGSPDLDLRPAPMQRSTMRFWIKKCPECGYVHGDIEKNAKQHKTFIKSKKYKLCEGKKIESVLARGFYKYGLILLSEQETVRAYDAFLHAAWVSDDNNDKKGAQYCRDRAIELYDDALFDNPNLQLRHVDLLRRTGRFSEAVKFCDEHVFAEGIMKKISEFQKQLCQSKDTGCYCIADCNEIL